MYDCIVRSGNASKLVPTLLVFLRVCRVILGESFNYGRTAKAQRSKFSRMCEGRLHNRMCRFQNGLFACVGHIFVELLKYDALK